MNREVLITVHAVDKYIERVSFPVKLLHDDIVRELTAAFANGVELTPLEKADVAARDDHDGTLIRKARIVFPEGSRARKQYGIYGTLIMVVSPAPDRAMKTCWVSQNVGTAHRKRRSRNRQLRKEYRRMNNRRVLDE